MVGSKFLIRDVSFTLSVFQSTLPPESQRQTLLDEQKYYLFVKILSWDQKYISILLDPTFILVRGLLLLYMDFAFYS